MTTTREEETLHVHKKPFFKDLHILLLLIPSLTFVLILTVYVRSVGPLNHAYTKSNSNTLAKSSAGLGIAKTSTHEFPLVIADSEYERRLGLGEKDEFPYELGMLFNFGMNDIRPPFWMKGMRFSLDIIWVNDGIISQIDKNVPPEPGVEDQDLKLYIPHDPIDYVIEVNAGFTDTYNIQEGDPVEIKLD